MTPLHALALFSEHASLHSNVTQHISIYCLVSSNSSSLFSSCRYTLRCSHTHSPRRVDRKTVVKVEPSLVLSGSLLFQTL